MVDETLFLDDFTRCQRSRNSRCPGLQEEEEDRHGEKCQHASNSKCLICNRACCNELDKQACNNSDSNAYQKFDELEERWGGRRGEMITTSTDPVHHGIHHLPTVTIPLSASTEPLHTYNLLTTSKRRRDDRQDNRKQQDDGDQFMVCNTSPQCTQSEFTSNRIAEREGQIGTQSSQGFNRRRHTQGRWIALCSLTGATAEYVTIIVQGFSTISFAGQVMYAPARLLFLSTSRADIQRISAVGQTRETKKRSTMIRGSLYGMQISDIAHWLNLLGIAPTSAINSFHAELLEIYETLRHAGSNDQEEHVLQSAFGGRVHATQRQLIESTRHERSALALKSRFWKRIAQHGVGPTTSCLLFYAAIADTPLHSSRYTKRPSLVSLCRSFLCALQQFQDPHAYIDAHMGHVIHHDIRRLKRGIAALECVELQQSIEKLSVQEGIRAEIATLRQAAWPPRHVVSYSSLTHDQYDTRAIQAGVDVGHAHASGTYVQLDRFVPPSRCDDDQGSMSSWTEGSVLSSLGERLVANTIDEINQLGSRFCRELQSI